MTCAKHPAARVNKALRICRWFKTRAKRDSVMHNLIYAPPTHPYISVQFVDDDLLIVSKQSGLLSVPGRTRALADCIHQRIKRDYPEATIVHRLDLETSGVMVLARNRESHRHLSWQFENRRVEKAYVARVWGRIAGDAGMIDAPLMRDWPNRPRQKIDYVEGRQARTRWAVIDREHNVTRVELQPETGRSHQLRVHMQSLGHPILGDPLYAPSCARQGVERLQLHAQSLSFQHPTREETIAFQDPCPF